MYQGTKKHEKTSHRAHREHREFRHEKARKSNRRFTLIFRHEKASAFANSAFVAIGYYGEVGSFRLRLRLRRTRRRDKFRGLHGEI